MIRVLDPHHGHKQRILMEAAELNRLPPFFIQADKSNPLENRFVVKPTNTG
jgi:hypothetical protein